MANSVQVTKDGNIRLVDNGDGTYSLSSVSIPDTANSSVQRSSAGFMAPGQTAKQFAAKQSTSVTNSTPAAPTAATAAGTSLGIGAYKYQITYVSNNGGAGESTGGTEGTVTTTSNNQNVHLTAIPTGPTGTTARNIYRTAVGGATGTEKFVATIADNTTTTYTDTTADGSLGASVPTVNTFNQTIVALETVTTGKTLYITDAIIFTDLSTPIDGSIQAAGVGIFYFGVSTTAPVSATSMETQPNAASTQAVTLVLPATTSVQKVWYNIFGFEQ